MKKITPNTDQLAALRRSVGDENFDPARVSVFEASFTTSRPLSAGGIYKGARITRSGLEDMANRVNSANEAVPIHIEHNLGGSLLGAGKDDLPIGKAFHAAVVKADDSEFELRGLFYIDGAVHGDIVAKIESSTISEMSIQASWKNAISNKSGFNFLAPGNEEFAWGRVDNEGNALGVDNHHVFVSGLDKWYETSLVGRGAAPGARIHARSGEFQLAAASVHDIIATMRASRTLDAGELNAPDLVALNTKLSTAETAVTDLTTKLSAATSRVTALETELSDTKTKATSAEQKTAMAEAAVTAAGQAVAEASAALREHADAAAVAAGVEKPKDNAPLAELTEVIKASAKKLHQVIPVDGVSQSIAKPNLTTRKAPAVAGAFRVAA